MRFPEFYENELHMSSFFDSFSDSRKKPQIPASIVGRSIIYMLALKLQSTLQFDQMARLPIIRKLFKTQRPMVASDTTLQRVLSLFDFQPITNTIRAIYTQIVGRGLSKFHFSSGKRLRIAAIDGSGFGHHYASVIAMIGSETFPLDCHVSEIKGKELLCSRAVLSSITDSLGKSWCDILVADGLYTTKTDFIFATKNLGCHLLVKTSEQTLSIIQHAKAILSSNNPDVKSASGYDALHDVNYQVKSISGLTWQGIPYPLTVARIIETKLHPKPRENPTEEFFVITTAPDLSVNELREVAHARWFIENNVFKRLNALIKSKRFHTKSLPTLSRLLPLWLIGLSLLQLFILKFQNLNWQSVYGKLRSTFLFLVSMLYLSIFSPLPQEIFIHQDSS